MPVLIYPSPLATGPLRGAQLRPHLPRRGLRGTNALLYPRLGDYALLKLAGEKEPLATEMITAGLFDDFWRIK